MNLANPASERISMRFAVMALVGFVVGCSPAAAQTAHRPQPVALQETQVTQSTPSFIEVSGTAQVSVPSDRARISFAVETESAQAETAARDNADRMDRVIRAVRSEDLPGLSVETFGYALEPRYARQQGQEGEPRIVGYRALNHVRVSVDDVDAVGGLLDRAIAAGANRVASLQFEAIDTEPARLDAVGQAVRKARSEAEAMAAALGVELGPVLEVRGGAQMPAPLYRSMGRMEMVQMAAAPTPIESGSQTVTATVTVRFAIGG